MFKKHVFRKEICMWGGQTRTLEYSVICDRIIDYGLSVKVEESGEECILRHISTDKSLIEGLLNAIADNTVTPVALCEVVSDWIESHDFMN